MVKILLIGTWYAIGVFLPYGIASNPMDASVPDCDAGKRREKNGGKLHTGDIKQGAFHQRADFGDPTGVVALRIA